MSSTKPEGDLPGEFRKLGQNLKAALKTAWESEESQRLQGELQTGLAALEAGLKEATRDFRASEAGQRLQSEAAELGERVRSGEVENRLRADLLAALQRINAELDKAVQAPGDREAPPRE